jgi:hypothetical protein
MIWKRAPIKALLLLLLLGAAGSAWHLRARQGGKAPAPQPWDAGKRIQGFQAPSTLAITNDCIEGHTFTVTKRDADFKGNDFLELDFTQPVSVPSQSTVQLPVLFHTAGISPGYYSGLVTIQCLDCTEVPPCTQNLSTLVAKITVLPAAPPSDSSTPTTPTTTETIPPPVAPPAPPPVPTPVTPGDHTTERPPETPPPPSNSVTETLEQKKGCCCIVDDLQLLYKGPTVVPSHTEVYWTRDENGDPVKQTRQTKDSYGHKFKVVIVYEKKGHNDAGTTPADCVLQWREKTSRPPESNIAAGVIADKWNDIGQVLGGYNPKYVASGTTLGPWYQRFKQPDEKMCPHPRKRIELTDAPAVIYGRSRTLFFNIIVSSGVNCGPTKELWAKQVLERNPGDKDTKFYVSNDAGVTWIPAK